MIECPDVLLFRLWSPARERRIYRTQTQAGAYVMRLLRYEASPSRCDDSATTGGRRGPLAMLLVTRCSDASTWREFEGTRGIGVGRGR